jgi:hypothetical protein
MLKEGWKTKKMKVYVLMYFYTTNVKHHFQVLQKSIEDKEHILCFNAFLQFQIHWKIIFKCHKKDRRWRKEYIGELRILMLVKFFWVITCMGRWLMFKTPKHFFGKTYNINLLCLLYHDFTLINPSFLVSNSFHFSWGLWFLFESHGLCANMKVWSEFEEMGSTLQNGPIPPTNMAIPLGWAIVPVGANGLFLGPDSKCNQFDHRLTFQVALLLIVNLHSNWH